MQGHWAKRTTSWDLLGSSATITERDLWVKASAMEILTPETTQGEVTALYQEVYQLKRNPGEVLCSEDTMEETHIEILVMLREHLQCRQISAQLEELK